MKSPCHDCGLKDADKNGEECLRCNSRFEYAQAIEVRTLDPDIRIVNPKKEEMNMSKKGTCVNCGRPDMYIPAFDKCFSCYDVVRQAKKIGASQDEIDASLAKVKERIKSGVSMKNHSGKKKARANVSVAKKPGPKPVQYKAVSDIESGDLLCAVKAGSVCLGFNDERDKKIREYIDNQAREARRSPDQQIMWILQHYIEVAGTPTQP